MNNDKIITIKDAYLDYIKYAKLHLKPTTILNIERKFKLHIIPYIGNFNIYEFSESNYMDWQRCIRDLKYSKSFNKAIQSLMINFFDYLRLNYKIHNIPKLVKSFYNYHDVKKTNINILKYRDFKKFIKGTKKDILYNTLFEFLYFTGVRKGELLALNWNDLNKRYIYIDKTITKELFNGERLITIPKTKTSIRKIKLDLKTYIKLLKLKKYYIKNDKSFNNNYFIFGGSKPIATTTLDRKKNYYFDKANVKRIRIHDFRHSHATLLYKSKCDIKLIQQRLGHASIDTTLNTYVHYNDEKRVLRALDFLHLIF